MVRRPVEPEGLELGEKSFFCHVGRAGKVDLVTVGVSVEDFPIAVADLGLARWRDIAREQVAVDVESVNALNVEADPVSDRAAGELCQIAGFLQHEVGGAEGEPGPADFAGIVRGPPVLEREAKALGVESERSLHVGDQKERNDGADFGCGHGETSTAEG